MSAPWRSPLTILAAMSVLVSPGARCEALTVTVAIRNFAFDPETVSIRAGDRVRWVNQDSIEHTATSQTGPGTLIPSGAFDSALLNPGESFDFEFNAVGTFHYYCVPHGSSMQGVVLVLPLCPADLDNDGQFANGGTPDNSVEISDLLYFLAGFELGSPSVDVDDDGDGEASNPDGAVTVDDLLFFLNRFERGC